MFAHGPASGLAGFRLCCIANTAHTPLDVARFDQAAVITLDPDCIIL
jgi:hypothetical protein